MKAVCVDDEELVLGLTVEMCRDIDILDEVDGFTDPEKALEYMKVNPADIVLLDIDMPRMNGIELAMAVKEVNPDIRIVFVTGYSQYAVKAFELHASGYLLKPISKDQLEKEIRFALADKSEKELPHIMVRTFGNFTLFVDGESVSFSRAKARELLAYLVDRQGAEVSRKAVFAVLWEEGEYDRSMQKQLDVIIRSLKTTLEEHGVSEIVKFEKGMARVIPETFDCDLYRFFEGDVDAINSFHGEYMSDYSWASITEAYMDRYKDKN